MAKPAIDVGIVTGDAGPVVAFYVEAFGFVPQEGLTIPGIGKIHKLACGESILRIMEPEKPAEADPTAGAFAARCGLRYLTLEVVDIGAAVEAARGAGGSVLLEPIELRPGRFVSQVADPDGNTVELGQG